MIWNESTIRGPCRKTSNNVSNSGIGQVFDGGNLAFSISLLNVRWQSIKVSRSPFCLKVRLSALRLVSGYELVHYHLDLLHHV